MSDADTRRGALFGLHILVAEDNEDASQILRMLFSYFGAAVTTAKTAGEALTVLRQISPDIVIADMQLGRSNATWLIGEARRIPYLAPFIAISGNDFDEAQLQELGFEAFLRKPLDHDRLIDIVLSSVKRR